MEYEVVKKEYYITNVNLPDKSIVLSSYIFGHKIDNFPHGIEYDKISITYLSPKMVNRNE